MSVTVHKSGNVQEQTITQKKECTETDHYKGEGMYRERSLQSRGNVQGQRIFHRRRNVQGHPIIQGKIITKQRECTGTENFSQEQECTGTEHF